MGGLRQAIENFKKMNEICDFLLNLQIQTCRYIKRIKNVANNTVKIRIFLFFLLLH